MEQGECDHDQHYVDECSPHGGHPSRVSRSGENTTTEGAGEKYFLVLPTLLPSTLPGPGLDYNLDIAAESEMLDMRGTSSGTTPDPACLGRLVERGIILNRTSGDDNYSLSQPLRRETYENIHPPMPGGTEPAGGEGSREGFPTFAVGRSSLGTARPEELGERKVVEYAEYPAQGVNTWTGDSGWLAPDPWVWLGCPWQSALDSVVDTSQDVETTTLLGCQTDPEETSPYNTFLTLYHT